MSAELIYRTTSPAAEAWWKHARELLDQQRELRNAFEEEMLTTYGLPQKHLYGESEGRRALYVNSRTVTGLDAGYSEQPPAGSGWRLDSKDRIWKPALRTPAGRALAKRLDSLTLYIVANHVEEIGVPQLVFSGSYLHRPGFESDDEPFVLYQVWGSGGVEKDCLATQATHPEIEWVEVKRSDWYAREEAKAEAHA